MLQDVCGGQSSHCFQIGRHLLLSKKESYTEIKKRMKYKNTEDKIGLMSMIVLCII